MVSVFNDDQRVVIVCGIMSFAILLDDIRLLPIMLVLISFILIAMYLVCVRDKSLPGDGGSLTLNLNLELELDPVKT